MPDYDGFLEEPLRKQRKYHVRSRTGWSDVNWPRHWTVLLSVSQFDIDEVVGEIIFGDVQLRV